MPSAGPAWARSTWVRFILGRSGGRVQDTRKGQKPGGRREEESGGGEEEGSAAHKAREGGRCGAPLVCGGPVCGGPVGGGPVWGGPVWERHGVETPPRFHEKAPGEAKGANFLAGGESERNYWREEKKSDILGRPGKDGPGSGPGLEEVSFLLPVGPNWAEVGQHQQHVTMTEFRNKWA